jgi:3-hydroxybutyryl-CoA dehydrogenase
MKKKTHYRHVWIAGAGTMGHGLALLMARAGCTVSLSDPDDGVLTNALNLVASHLDVMADEGLLNREDVRATKNRIHPASPAPVPTQADLIIEAISEDVDAKRDFFAGVARNAPDDTVVASNTSYLNIFDLAPAGLQRRLMICHFFAPPYIIPLVEVVNGPDTDPAVTARMQAFLASIGQTPVLVEKFIPGFIVNRLQRALGREIFHLIDQGYARPEQIDKAVRASLGIRMPVVGVVKRYDFAGLDFTAKVLSNPSIGLVNEDRPSPAVDACVEKGHCGVKSGKGFYDYKNQTPAEIYEQRDRLLIKMRRVADEIGQAFWRD